MNAIIIGFGWIAQNVHLPILKTKNEINNIYVYEPDISKWNKDFRVEFINDYEKVLSMKNISIVVICSPNHNHFQHIKDLSKICDYIFIEKPAVISRDESDYLINSLSNKVVLLHSTPNKYRKDIQDLIKYSRKIGNIYKINTKWLRTSGIPYREWGSSKYDNVSIDLGPHLSDIIISILGDFNILKSHSWKSEIFSNDSSQRASWFLDNKNQNKIMETNSFKSIITSQNQLINIELSWASHINHDLTSIEIYGDEGYCEFNGLFGFNKPKCDNTIHIKTRDEDFTKTYATQAMDSFNEMWDYYLDIINSKRKTEDMTLKGLNKIILKEDIND